MKPIVNPLFIGAKFLVKKTMTIMRLSTILIVGSLKFTKSGEKVSER